MLCIGHSLVSSLHFAASKSGLNSFLYYLSRVEPRNTSQKFKLSEIEEHFPLRTCPPVFINIFGIEMLLSQFNTHHPFDFYVEDNTSFLPGAQIVPQEIIEECADSMLRGLKYKEFLIEIQRVITHKFGNVPIYHLPLPPVSKLTIFGSENSTSLNWEDVIQRRPTNIHANQKIRDLLDSKKKEIAESLGMMYLQNPPEVYDEEGFLHTKGFFDGFHANDTWYGMLFLDMLRKQGIL